MTTDETPGPRPLTADHVGLHHLMPSCCASAATGTARRARVPAMNARRSTTESPHPPAPAPRAHWRRDRPFLSLGFQASAHYVGTTFLLWDIGSSPLFPSLYPHFLWTAGLSTTVDKSVRSAQFSRITVISKA